MTEIVLNRKHFRNIVRSSTLLSAIYDGILWRAHRFKDWLGTRVWRKTRVIVTSQGFRFESGFHPAYSRMRDGSFEPVETEILSKLFPKVDRFVDVGANVGYFSCLALHFGVPVVCFEPQAQNLRCLLNNIVMNGWEVKAEVFPLALSNRVGVITLFGASGPSASLIENWAGYSPAYKQLVPVSLLDNVLCRRFENEQLLIKIDVEGAELGVLKGAVATIGSAVSPYWLIEICASEYHPDGFNPHFADTFQIFFDAGYQCFAAAETLDQVHVEDVKNWQRERRSGAAAHNYLFVPAARGSMADLLA